MAEETGAALYCAWNYPAVTAGSATLAAGTLVLSTDYRTMTPIDDTQATVDASAGADTERIYLKTLKDGQMAISFLNDSGTTLPIILAAGNNGTLIIGPSGTATNMLKITKPSTISGSKLTTGYEQISIWDLQFKPTAARIYSVW